LRPNSIRNRFILEEHAASAFLLNGFAVGGWHTAAVAMRLLVESDLKPAGGIVGPGFEELCWL